MYKNYLCHYGVQGMRWGVRKSKPKKSSITPRTSVKVAKSLKKNKRKPLDNLKVNKKSKKEKKNRVKIKDLSDADLQKRINRLQMEKRYRDLKKDELSEGRKLVGDIMKTVGKTVGVQVGTYVSAKVINKLMDDEVVSTKSKKKNQQSKSKLKAA